MTTQSSQDAKEKLTLEEIQAWSKTPAGQEGRRRLRLAAEALRERYSHIPFHARKAEKHGFQYWIDLAQSNPLVLPASYRANQRPETEGEARRRRAVEAIKQRKKRRGD